jgi:hypothetical protein
MKRVFTIFLTLVIMIGLSTPIYAQTTVQECEKCGMTVDSMGQARFNIVDVNSTRHYACCPMCAFALLKTYGELNYTSFCDQYGPSFPITIQAEQYGSVVTISPPSAMVILGGGCAKNRIVYNSSAAEALLAPPNNGTSKWLSPVTNATVLPNATRRGIAEAILTQGGGTSATCERCGMTVDATGQARFRILDSNGTTHIACCPICMLRILNSTGGQFNVTSYCDYYGTSYPITMSIRNYGSEVQVTPSTALIINGGGCTKNRIVYNSTAADLLLAAPNNGTSKWLSPLTNATVLPNATRMSVAVAALQFGGGTVIPEFSATGMTIVLAVIATCAIFAGKKRGRNS